MIWLRTSLAPEHWTYIMLIDQQPNLMGVICTL